MKFILLPNCHQNVNNNNNNFIILIFLKCLCITCTHSLWVLNPPLPRKNLPHSTLVAAGKQILSRDVRSQFPTGVNANSVCHSLHSSKSLWKQTQWYNVCIRMHRVTGTVHLGVSIYPKKSLTTLLSCPTTVNVLYCSLTNKLLLQNMSSFVWISYRYCNQLVSHLDVINSSYWVGWWILCLHTSL